MDITESLLLKNLNMPKVSQIGIVVNSIEQSLPYYKAVLNTKRWYRANIKENEVFYRENKINLSLDIVLGYSGRLQFELIEVLDGDENMYSNQLLDSGQGFSHIGFHVPNIDKKLLIMKELGVNVIQQGTIISKAGSKTRYAYMDTIAVFGYITEFIETKLSVFPVPQNKFIMGIGALTGDLSKIKNSE